MSFSDNFQQITPSSASGTVPKLEEAIESACQVLDHIFKEDADNRIKNNLCIAWAKVYSTLWEGGDSNLKARLRGLSEFLNYVTPGSNEERELIDSMESMAKRGVPWRDLFENKAFFKPGPDKGTDPATDQATLRAWDYGFKGDHARALFHTISDYLSKDRTPDARLTTIVNSSGTGKSRMVDRLGTETITVPMCLRQRGRSGFPPVDETLRDWLVSGTSDQTAVRKRLNGFTYSLLVITCRQLETIAKERDISKLPRFDEGAGKKLYEEKPEECVSMVVKRQKRLASAFREHMTKCQTYHYWNSDRETFYKQVIELSEEFVESSQPDNGRYVSKGKGVQEAGEMLCRSIDEHGVLESDKGPRQPLVVLAFDEADTLTDNPRWQEHWNLFSELRRVLQQIQHLPIFSLFLSTAGRFDRFPLDIHSDSSARVREPDIRPLDPISETSFDDIAYPALKGTITMDNVVEIGWISHFGRPLFGSYWDNLPMRCKIELTIMDYAKQKLLDGPTELTTGNRTGSLACLSTRFALEFNMDGTANNVTYELVERHMRLCIAATTGYEKMITISGSEPLLAEAAYELIKGTGANAVCHLAEHSYLDCIDRGRRGELVAALLIMQAYDAARDLSRERWVSVVNFMEALLPPLKYNTLCQSVPTSLPRRHRNQKTFEAIFKDYGMWFNHVIKIERKEMMSIDHLWKFIVRGAMILCSTNQEGIDIVLPVGHMTEKLGPDTVTAMIIQVKNARDYKATIQEDLFDAMDAVVTSTIFSKTPRVDSDPDSDSDSDSKSTAETLLDTSAEPSTKRRKVSAMPKKVAPEPVMVNPKAVIRMVFALASPEPGVVFRSRPESKRRSDGFAAFDMWLAGLSDETFRQTKNADLKHYETLLERSLVPHDAFELKDMLGISKKTKKWRRACRRRMAPLTFPGHAHSIHQNPKIPGEGS